MMKKLLALVMVFGLCAFVAACGDGGKAAAEAAVGAAQSSFDVVKAEASTYVPDQAKTVQDALSAATDGLAKGNYAQVLADAPTLAPKVSALAEAAAAKKAELTKTWTDLSAGLPAVVRVIQSRVDMLSKSKKLPPSISADAFTGAKSGLETITKTWADASDAFKSGNVMDAVAKAQAVKAKAAEVMTSLGMSVPDALR